MTNTISIHATNINEARIRYWYFMFLSLTNVKISNKDFNWKKKEEEFTGSGLKSTSTALEASMLTITPPMRFGRKESTLSHKSVLLKYDNEIITRGTSYYRQFLNC